MSLGMVKLGRLNLMFVIQVVNWILPFGLGLGLELFSKRVRDATHGVAAVGALPLGCKVKLGLVRVSICLLVFMLLRLRMFLFLLWLLSVLPFVGRFSKMAMVRTPAVLSLLDGPSGVDPAYFVVSTQFFMVRRYLAYWLGEVPRVYRVLDLVARGRWWSWSCSYVVSLCC